MPEGLVVTTSADNSSYAVVDPNAMSVRLDEWGLWHFELAEPVDVSTFENVLGEMLIAWQQTNRVRLEYAYDSRGNRIQETVTKASDESWTYLYDKTDRLITDGRYAYAFDLNGNMTAKSNRYAFTQSGGRYEVVFHDISQYDPFAESWEYTWDLFNRLSEVRKNGEFIGRYTYNLRPPGTNRMINILLPCLGGKAGSGDIRLVASQTLGCPGSPFFPQARSHLMRFARLKASHRRRARS